MDDKKKTDGTAPNALPYYNLPANTPMFFIGEEDGLFLYGSSCCMPNSMHWGMVVSSVELEANQLGCGNGNPGISALGAMVQDDPDSGYAMKGIYSFGDIGRGAFRNERAKASDITTVTVESGSQRHFTLPVLISNNAGLINDRSYSVKGVKATIKYSNNVVVNLDFLLAYNCREKEGNSTEIEVSSIEASEGSEFAQKGRFLLLRLDDELTIDNVTSKNVWVINRFGRG